MSHSNNGKCEKCQQIFDKYPGFNNDLQSWFIDFQSKHPEGHVSCAGRGSYDQIEAFKNGASKAKYGQSAHNYNCAIDLFVNSPLLSLYDSEWFDKTLAPEIPDFLCWYGAPGSAFFELPHIEVKNWKELRDQGLTHLVEEVKP